MKKVPATKKQVVVILFIIVSFFALPPSFGLADKSSSEVQLTDIEVTEKAIIIKADGPFAYNISQSDDPFRAVVDMGGIGPGRFRDRIYPKRGLVTEIAPSERLSPPGVRLDILLQTPSTLLPEWKDDSLVLLVQGEQNAASDSPPERGAHPASVHDGATTVISLTLNTTEEGAEMIIEGDGRMPEPVLSATEAGVVLDIPGVVMKTTIPSKLPPPVRTVRQLELGDRTRFLIETTGEPESEAFAVYDEVILVLYPKERTAMKEARAALSEKATKKTPDLISLDFQAADIVPILRLLGDVGGYNIIIHPDVKGNITMKLLNVPWDQAMDIILRTFSLEKIVEGNVIRITTLKNFQEEKKAIAETREVFGTAEPVETRVFILNYSEVDKMKDSIASAKVLSPRGNISTDTRTKSIVVKDVSSVLSEVAKLVEVLDKPTPQVSIESRIVEVSSSMARSLGVEWGFKAEGNNLSARGSEGNTITGGNLAQTSFARFPAGTTSITDPSSALTVGYLNTAQTFGLDLRLSAIADIGKGKIISNPKVVTTDNQKARIIQGETIPYGEKDVESGQISTKFKDVALSIEVTPKISNDGTISMNVVTTKEELVRMEDIGSGVIAPRTTKIEGSTTVQVKDGETMVIGGIYKNISKDSTAGVPGLMDIPLLGWLFKRNTVEDETREVMIFITPRIVKQ